jgi:hypothetical protein
VLATRVGRLIGDAQRWPALVISRRFLQPANRRCGIDGAAGWQRGAGRSCLVGQSRRAGNSVTGYAAVSEKLLDIYGEDGMTSSNSWRSRSRATCAPGAGLGHAQPLPQHPTPAHEGRCPCLRQVGAVRRRLNETVDSLGNFTSAQMRKVRAALTQASARPTTRASKRSILPPAVYQGELIAALTAALSLTRRASVAAFALSPNGRRAEGMRAKCGTAAAAISVFRSSGTATADKASGRAPRVHGG